MPLTTGTILGPYEVQSLLGQGGMGEVYRVRDSTLGRDVALKVLSSSLGGDADRLARFEREARTLAALNHPHIAQVHGLVDAGGVRGIVMELVEGDDLAQRLKSGALGIDEALAIARQLADAIEAAHEQGVIHRDLKPANIKVRPDGTVKVLDFGLAKGMDSSSPIGSDPATLANSPTMTAAGVTMSGMILGTAAYMAPEQAKGKSVDKRADIWAFGCVLYEMLAGVPAVQGDSVTEILAAVLHKPPDLSRLPAATPAGITALLTRCFRPDPRQRLRDIGDARLEIDAILSQTPEARTAPLGPGSGAQSASSRRWLVVAASSAVVVAGFAGGWVSASRSASVSVGPPLWRQLTYRQGFVDTARLAPDGQTVVYSAAWDGAPIQSFATTTVSPESRPLDLAPAGVLAISRDGQLAVALGCRFAVASATCRGTLARVPLLGGAPRSIAENVQSADWGTGDDLAVVRQATDGALHVEYPVGTVLSDQGHGHVRLSPDRRRVAWTQADRASNSNIVMLRDQSGTRNLSPAWQFISALAWAADGKALYVSGQRPDDVSPDHVERVTLDGSRTGVLSSADRLRALDVAPDGRLLVDRAAINRSISLRNLDAPSGLRDLTWLGHSVGEALSADGKTLLFSERGGSARGRGSFDIYVRPTDGGPAVRLGGPGFGHAISNDGRWALTSTRPERGASELVVFPLSSGTARTLDRGGLEIGAAASFPADFIGNERVIFRGRRGTDPWRTYVQAIDGPPALLEHEPGFQVSPMSPDQTRFVSQRADGSLWVAAIVTGPATQLPLRFSGRQQILEWTADGRGLFMVTREANRGIIVRVDVATGKPTPVVDVQPQHPAGFDTFFARGFFITPDGKTLAVSESRMLSAIFLVGPVP